MCAMDHLNMTVPVGAIDGFIGENGGGKSTTEKLICGCLAPDEGEIKLFGRDYTDPGVRVRQDDPRNDHRSAGRRLPHLCGPEEPGYEPGQSAADLPLQPGGDGEFHPRVRQRRHRQRDPRGQDWPGGILHSPDERERHADMDRAVKFEKNTFGRQLRTMLAVAPRRMLTTPLLSIVVGRAW